MSIFGLTSLRFFLFTNFNRRQLLFFVWSLFFSRPISFVRLSCSFVSPLLVSTYVVCERLSVMHEPAGVVENLVQNSTVYPYSAIQNTPPPLPPPPKMKIVRNLGTLTFQLQNTPPPNENCQKSWHFDFSVAEYPPPPPRKLKFRQILALCDFSVLEYPPPQIEI